LFPDCEFTANTAKLAPGESVDLDTGPDEERNKRIVIDHINLTHDEAHVITPCAHDFQHLEDFEATTRDGTTGVELTLPQERLQCARCMQFEVREREYTGAETDGAIEVEP